MGYFKVCEKSSREQETAIVGNTARRLKGLMCVLMLIQVFSEVLHCFYFGSKYCGFNNVP